MEIQATRGPRAHKELVGVKRKLNCDWILHNDSACPNIPHLGRIESRKELASGHQHSHLIDEKK